MTRLSRALSIAMLLILAACTSTTDLGRSTPDPTPEPTPTASASPEPSSSPSAPETDSPAASPSPSQIEGEGGFTYEANADADALMLDRFDCQNLDVGYQVSFPADWNTNAELGSVPPCSWFAPTEYETRGGSLPPEVAIDIFVIDGAPDYYLEIIDQDSGLIGATQPATRVHMTGNDGYVYEYVVQLGPTPEEGPNLVARTTSEMGGGDYALNRAILDRMMATMEFIGVIQ